MAWLWNKGGVSDEIFEVVNRQPSISDNTAHGEGIHGICKWDGQNPFAIGHRDVLSFSNNPVAAFFKSSHGSLVADPGKFRHEQLLRTVLVSPRTARP